MKKKLLKIVALLSVAVIFAIQLVGCDYIEFKGNYIEANENNLYEVATAVDGNKIFGDTLSSDWATGINLSVDISKEFFAQDGADVYETVSSFSLSQKLLAYLNEENLALDALGSISTNSYVYQKDDGVKTEYDESISASTYFKDGKLYLDTVASIFTYEDAIEKEGENEVKLTTEYTDYLSLLNFIDINGGTGNIPTPTPEKGEYLWLVDFTKLITNILTPNGETEQEQKESLLELLEIAEKSGLIITVDTEKGIKFKVNASEDLINTYKALSLGIDASETEIVEKITEDVDEFVFYFVLDEDGLFSSAKLKIQATFTYTDGDEYVENIINTELGLSSTKPKLTPPEELEDYIEHPCDIKLIYQTLFKDIELKEC